MLHSGSKKKATSTGWCWGRQPPKYTLRSREVPSEVCLESLCRYWQEGPVSRKFMAHRKVCGVPSRNLARKYLLQGIFCRFVTPSPDEGGRHVVRSWGKGSNPKTLSEDGGWGECRPAFPSPPAAMLYQKATSQTAGFAIEST